MGVDVKARTQCINQIRALLVNGQPTLRELMKQLPKAKMIKTLARLRPGADLADPATGCKQALRYLVDESAALLGNPPLGDEGLRLTRRCRPW